MKTICSRCGFDTLKQTNNPYRNRDNFDHSLWTWYECFKCLNIDYIWRLEEGKETELIRSIINWITRHNETYADCEFWVYSSHENKVTDVVMKKGNKTTKYGIMHKQLWNCSSKLGFEWNIDQVLLKMSGRIDVS